MVLKYDEMDKQTALGGLEISQVRIILWGLPWQFLPNTSPWYMCSWTCVAITSHHMTKFVIRASMHSKGQQLILKWGANLFFGPPFAKKTGPITCGTQERQTEHSKPLLVDDSRGLCYPVFLDIVDYNRRKFWSQTSNQMDRWKSRGGKSQGGEEKQWEDERKKRERRKKVEVHEKVGQVGKSRFTVFFYDLWLRRVEK